MIAKGTEMLRIETKARHAWAVLPFVCLLADGVMSRTSAQGIDPWYLVPAADGTNLIESSVTYHHFDAFHYSNGISLPGVSLDDYIATIRYAHFFYIGGLPAGLQIFQSAGYGSNWQVNGSNLDNAPGMHKLLAGNTTLSAFLWPYASEASQTYLYTAAYLTPPDGSYAANYAFNEAYGGWQGDLQVGAFKGFGSNVSLEGAGDVQFHGSESLPFGEQSNTDPTYRLQLWANWDWGNGVRTALGYTGVFGGAASVTSQGIRHSLYRNAEVQAIQASVSYWWTPRVLTELGLDHDVQAGGGYQLGLGATGRIRVQF